MRFLVLSTITIFSFSCTRNEQSAGPKDQSALRSNGTVAGALHIRAVRAVLDPLGNNKANGVVEIELTTDKQVSVIGSVSGLKPNSEHGFHIHEYGHCGAEDGSLAGDHFNPQGHPHAGPNNGKHHAGDLGNIRADDKGVATISLKIKDPLYSSDLSIIAGRSLVLHAQRDDLKSQPSGNSGARIACGVIGVTATSAATP